MKKPSIHCKQCGVPILEKEIYEQMAQCRSCGHHQYVDQKSPYKRITLIAGSLVIIGIAALIWTSLRPVNYDKKVAELSDSKVLYSMLETCNKEGGDECRTAIFRRLSEIDPTDVVAKANWAMSLTRLKKHLLAEGVYKELIDSGEGTYDLMSYYADTLMALGKYEEAQKWLINALSLVPNLVDVTDNLAKVLIKLNRRFEAVTLLESFIQKYPNSKGFLNGHLLSAKNGLAANTTNMKTLRLYGMTGGHHFLPIFFKQGHDPINFLIDTGATSLTMGTKEFKSHFPELMGEATPIALQLADGRSIKGYTATISKLKVAGWTLPEVNATFCETCENLAGRALLNHFEMKFIPNGGINILELSRANQ